MADPHFLTAQEAAHELGISLATLYAYVSRGMIQSEEIGGSKRSRRYSAEDVARLKNRKEQRRNPEKAVEGALHWGVPVLESAITLIEEGHLYYRGLDAIQLANENTFEQVAALIWLNTLQTNHLADNSVELSPRLSAMLANMADLPTFVRFQALLPIAAQEDHLRYDFAQTGARMLRLLTLIATGKDHFSGDIATFLQQSWLPDNPPAARLIDTALILGADHELNLSAFTARCVASANATLYDAVSAGLAALHGSKHGGHTRRVEALLREIGTVDNAHTILVDRLSRGDAIPGFGHNLYPTGDPRGRLLLDLTAEHYPDTPAVKLAQVVEIEVLIMLQQHPTIDFALVTLANALNLPPGTALTLFALGRTVGWIGHAVEQYAQDSLIRPRARYTGVRI